MPGYPIRRLNRPSHVAPAVPASLNPRTRQPKPGTKPPPTGDFFKMLPEGTTEALRKKRERRGQA